MIVNVNSRMSKKVSLFGFYTLGSPMETPTVARP